MAWKIGVVRGKGPRTKVKVALIWVGELCTLIYLDSIRDIRDNVEMIPLLPLDFTTTQPKSPNGKYS